MAKFMDKNTKNKASAKCLAKSVSVVVLAAGLGTRMKSNKAKVLQKICGKSMILHILKQAYALSDDVCVVLSHQKELVEDEIIKEFPNTRFLEQDLKNYAGTAGALRDYTPKYERVIALCGDMPLVKSSSIKALLDTKGKVAVAVFKSQNPANYGRVVIENDKIQKIVEFKDATEQERLINACNSGVYAFESAILKELLPKINNQNAAKEYYLTDIIALANEKGEFISPVFVNEAEFMGVNDKYELAKAENLMQDEFKMALMKQGVIFHNPQSAFISLDAVFEGECEIYEGVRVEGKCVLKNAIIKSGSVVEDSTIENSDIGPLAHIRPKCSIVNSHIGNFVECKNAILRGVKAGHLSYLGDCEIDEGTNIGCGTITCNYDGLKKHRTTIGKNVFIGSDTQLIAPVKIADESLIAAGSCVTSDVPSGSLFINRAKKQVIKDYFYQKFGVKK